MTKIIIGTLTFNQILSRVQEVLQDRLSLDQPPGEKETIFFDLGAESIDMIDLAFEIGKALQIQLSSEDLYPSDDLLGIQEGIEGGRFTEEGIQ